MRSNWIHRSLPFRHGKQSNHILLSLTHSWHATTLCPNYECTKCRNFCCSHRDSYPCCLVVRRNHGITILLCECTIHRSSVLCSMICTRYCTKPHPLRNTLSQGTKLGTGRNSFSSYIIEVDVCMHIPYRRKEFMQRTAHYCIIWISQHCNYYNYHFLNFFIVKILNKTFQLGKRNT
jgi:hypothetical protein